MPAKPTKSLPEGQCPECKQLFMDLDFSKHSVWNQRIPGERKCGTKRQFLEFGWTQDQAGYWKRRVTKWLPKGKRRDPLLVACSIVSRG